MADGPTKTARRPSGPRARAVESPLMPAKPIRLGLLTLVLLPGPGACSETAAPHFGTLRYRSKTLEVFASEELQACGGTYRYTEQWLAGLHDRLGRHGSPQSQRFYWGTEADFNDNRACPIGEGCAWLDERVAYGVHIPLEHEHAHIEFGPRRPPSILEEGAAVVFGATVEGMPDRGTDLMDGFDQRPIDGELYGAAGRLSRRIIDKHGLEDYLKLYARLDGEEGFAATRDAFFEVTGDDLESLAHAAAEDECRPESFSYHDVGCKQTPATPWLTDTSWRVSVELDCTASDVVGPQNGTIWTLRRLDLQRAGRLLFQLSGPDGSRGRARIAECGSCYGDSAFGGMVLDLKANAASTYDVIPGTYWIRFEAPVDEIQTMQLRVRADW